MSEMSDSIEVEGTWEEILCRAAEFSGRRVRIRVLSDASAMTPEQIARAWADECERLTPEVAPELRGLKSELRRMLADKFRSQGLHV
jgi:hypothetical protein